MNGDALIAGDCLAETLGGKTSENGGLLGGNMEAAAIAAHGLGAHAVAERTALHGDSIAAEIDTPCTEGI